MKIVIFAGGVGTRLWPLSRKNTPKQFEKILGNKSTLQLAAHRLFPDFSWEDIYISTGKAFIKTVSNQLPELPKSHIVGEPQMRDVGPAVGLMTAVLAKEFPNEPMAILWSDHLVKKEEHFRKILRTAGEVIKKNPRKIIFVAQKPRFASENLGWINFGSKQFEQRGISFHSFFGFSYRPTAEAAREYFTSGHHGWNLGYFVTTPGFLLDQFKKLVPELYKNIMEIVNTEDSLKFHSKLNDIYPKLEKVHFDNAILEHLDASDALVISENIEWSDIGAWEALKEALSSHENENVTRGNVMVEETIDSLVFNFTKQLVVGIGLNDMVVVNTGDVLLVCPKSSVPKIKELVTNLEGTSLEHLV